MQLLVPNGSLVTERWHPEEARRPILDEAPVFYPNEEEFKDSFKYIASLRQRAEQYGICRIVPPPSWNPPCPLKERTIWEKSKFSTSIQQLDQLQNRKSKRKKSRYQNNMMKRRRLLGKGMGSGASYEAVAENELGFCNESKEFGFDAGTKFTMEAFQKYADNFKKQHFCIKNADTDSRPNHDDLQKQWEPSIENIEGEYWRIVERPTEEIEILYGADIETAKFGSGFPKPSYEAMVSDTEEKYIKSDWNLNNISRLPGSMLSFESGDISGVMLPWLYVGMCFSSFCWHVEDHHLYSLNYMHLGAPKIWYGVPEKDALKLEAAMKKHLPDLFEEQPDLLHKLVTQISPPILKSEGVHVCRCVQHPGDFILTFPRAYHSGFSSGFNCAEALNMAPIDWLPHGQRAVQLYQEQGRRTTISHDKLLLGAAREAVRAHWELQLLRKETLDNLRWKDVCGKDGILTQALKERVDIECEWRKCLHSSSQTMKMDKDFDKNTERECIVCRYDLHLSAAGCQCSPDRYTCLVHAKQLCSCAWNTRSFLFLYEIGELNLLVEALEGRLSAIHRWANQDLGLTLSSYVSRSKSPESNPIGGRMLMKETKQEKQGLLTAISSPVIAKSTGLHKESNTIMSHISSSEEAKEREQRISNSTGTVIGPSTQQQEINQLPVLYFQPTDRKELRDKNRQHVQCRSLFETKTVDHSIQFREEVFGTDSNSLTLPVCQQEDSSYCEFISSERNYRGFSISAPEDKHLGDCSTEESKTSIASSLGDDDGIFLNGDEGEEAHESISSVKYVEVPARLLECDSKVTSCNYKDQILNTPKTNASLMNERDANSIPVMDKMEHLLHSGHMKVRDCGTGVAGKSPNNVLMKPISQSLACNVKYESTPLEKHMQGLSTNTGNGIQHHKLYGSGRSINSCNDEKPTLNFSSKVKSAACTPNDRDNYHSKNGPCVGNVVRFNYDVKPLDYGVVLPGKLWSNSQFIFPKGFKSRVRYLSVLDPEKTCYYISEILDGGLPGPIFMVSVEGCPSEAFINFSTDKCWDMVRERVNDEIMRHNSLGRTNLPIVQDPGCLNGIEMFGFSSPAIIQAIEAMDCKHICSEYWKSRLENQKAQHSLSVSSTGEIQHKEEPSDQEFNNIESQSTLVRNLLKKAKPEELHSFQNMLSGNKWSSNQEILVRLLDGEIRNRGNKNCR